jgi:glycosyltransferase involved in cell wall biosynthesis
VAEVSIIVTAYNIENYIEQCLDSVAAQTFSDIEVLVIDDGSSDSTPARIEEFCALDPRFVPVLLRENSPGGVATAANAGLDRARGEWIGFVDGDDHIEPTMVERLVRAAVAADSDLAICEYQEVVDGSGERRDPADSHRWAELTAPTYVLDVQSRRQFLRLISVPWRKLYRRRLLEDNAIRFPVSAGFYEDNPFHWSTVISARSIAVVPEVLCYHRVDRVGQTMAATDSRLFEIFTHHDTIRAWLVERGLLDVYETALVGWVISQLEWIARRTPPPLRRTLFDTVVPIVAAYSSETLVAALREGNKGQTARRLSATVAERDFAGFVRTLSDRPATDNPIATAAFHLKHSGVRHTATLTGRYLLTLVKGSRVARAAKRVGPSVQEPRGEDLMFGLMVIQQRLRDLDSQLSAMNGRLYEIERRLTETDGRRDAPTSEL